MQRGFIIRLKTILDYESNWQLSNCGNLRWPAPPSAGQHTFFLLWRSHFLTCADRHIYEQVSVEAVTLYAIIIIQLVKQSLLLSRAHKQIIYTTQSYAAYAAWRINSKFS